MKEQAGRIGNLPANINIMNPVPNKDAKTITGLIRKNGKVSGYELSDGRVLSKREGVALAKQGGIRGVVQGAGTVVQNQDLRLADQRAGYFIKISMFTVHSRRASLTRSPPPQAHKKPLAGFPGQGLLYRAI